MNAIVIAPATAVPITVRPAEGVPVKVVPVTVAPIRIDGVLGIPGASGISVLDVLASQAADGTVTLRFSMSDGEVHEVEFRTGGELPPGDFELSGAAAAYGVAEAVLRVERTFAGATVGSVTTTASLAAWLDIASFVAVSGSARGSLAATLNLAGTAQARSDVAASLAFTLELAGTVAARAQASGLMRLGVDMTLQATAECRATATGTVTVEVSFAGTSTGRGLASATLLAALDGAGSATGRGAASGSLFLARQLAASVSGIALASGTVELAAAAGYDADSQAYFNAMTVQPNATRKGHYDTLVKGLKSDGIWAKLIGYQLWASHDDQAGRVDLKAPSRVAQKINTPIFTVDRGFSGDGTGAYLDTMIADDPARMNGFAFGGHINVATGSNAGLLWWNSNAVRVFAGSGARLRSTNDATLVGSGPVGFSAGDRATSATQESYFNGQLVQSRSAASSGTPSTASSLTSHRSSSAAFSEGRIAVIFAASSLTADEHSKLHARTNTFLSAIGAA